MLWQERNLSAKEGLGKATLYHPFSLLLLQTYSSVINDEYAQGHLVPPFPQSAEDPFPIIQYADDTILVMQGCDTQLLHLKEILHRIAISTGLVVNYHKSCLLPINKSQEKAAQLASAFGCLIGTFPFTYLGLPMGLTKPQVKDYAPLISRIERRLSASS